MTEPSLFPVALAASLLLAACTQTSGPMDAPNLSAAATTYTVTNLAEGEAGAVSDDGIVAIGRTLSATRQVELLRWSAAGGVQRLAVVAGIGIDPLFVSDTGVIAGVVDVRLEDAGDDNGTIIGYSYTTTNQSHDVVWSPSGSLQDFGADVSLDDINMAGTVIGTRRDAANQSRAFTWTATGGFRELGTLGGAWSQAWAIADDGSVTGRSVTASSTEGRAYIWTPSGGMRDLGTLGGSLSEGYNLGGGSVTGFSYTSSGAYLDFVWSASTGMQLLTLGGRYRGDIEEINNSGVVTGYLSDASSSPQAFVWAPADGIQVLPGIAGARSVANDINDSGWIVGRSNGRAALWRPSASNKQNQTIAFTSTAPSSAVAGGTYTVSATASSGLAVSFSSSTTGVCTVSGSAVRFVAAGTCTVRADQAGNASYNPAPTVTQSFAVRSSTAPATYTADFTTAPVGRMISSIRLGRGVSGTGTAGGTVGLYARRKDKGGNTAMVASSARHLVISNGTTYSYSLGGFIDLKFGTFGTGAVTVNSVKVKSTTTTGGTVKVYRGSTLVKTVSVPKTGVGVVKTLTLGVTNATLVRVTLTGSGAIDDLVVAQ